MSLVNQLIAAIFSVLIGLVSGTIYIMSDSSEKMLLSQLESHSLDSATHLGLYMAPYIADEDTATIETTVNAIFDSGFYQRIDVMNADGKEIFVKIHPGDINSEVPQWFVNLVKFTPPQMTREVTFNWARVGAVFVQSRAGYAYEQLWKGAQETMIWFISLSLVCVLLISSLLRYILRPLKGVEEQALELGQGRYVEQKRIPSTRELRRVVETMNQMVRQVRKMFEEQARQVEQLRRSAYQDNLTGLANQRATEAQLSDRLDYRKDFGQGAMIYLRIQHLAQLNDKMGMESANSFIRQVAEQLNRIAEESEDKVIGRLTGADFVLLTSQSEQNQLQRLLDQLTEQIGQRFEELGGDRQQEQPVCIGVCDVPGDTSASQALSQARLALQQAESGQDAVHQFSTESQQQQSSDWRELVASSISQQKLFLQYQTLQDSDGETLQQELLARILDKEGVPRTAGEFINIVKELGLIIDMDRAVISNVIDYLTRHPDSPALTVNLSPQSVENREFRQWLSDQLGQHSMAGKLNFEMNETAVLNNMGLALELRENLREQNIGFGIDNFGVHPRGFGYLCTVQPDYIKVDGSLIQQIDSSDEDHFFVGSLVSVAHGLNIKAYAEHVERTEQADELISLDFDGTQGFLHGKPQALQP